MLRLISTSAIVVAAAALLALPASAGVAPATQAHSSGPDCLRAGQATLRELAGGRSLSVFAREGVPLSVIGGEGTAPLATVFRLHLTEPSLFPWCAAA